MTTGPRERNSVRECKPSCLVGQQEIRHRLARLRRLAPDAGRMQARDHAVDHIRELGADAPNVAGEGGEPLGEPRIHIAAALGALGKFFRKNLLGHVTPASMKVSAV